MLYIIIVSYKNAYLTLECINSIYKSTYKEFRIVVVDNNSPDNTYDILKEKLPKSVILIRTDKNGGFSYGNNVGIKYALNNNAEYIMLLNNDTVIDSNLIFNLLQNTNEFTVTVPKIYYYEYPNKIWYAGGKYNYIKGDAIHIGKNKKDNQKFNQKREVDFVTGCCVLIQKDILKKIGMLDESFFMYHEDVDLSFRLKENKIKMLYIPSAKMWHKVGSTSGYETPLTIYYGNRNRFFIINKYKIGFLSIVYIFFTRILKIIFGFFKKNNYDKYILKAWNDYKKGITGKVDL